MYFIFLLIVGDKKTISIGFRLKSSIPETRAWKIIDNVRSAIIVQLPPMEENNSIGGFHTKVKEIEEVVNEI